MRPWPCLKHAVIGFIIWGLIWSDCVKPPALPPANCQGESFAARTACKAVCVQSRVWLFEALFMVVVMHILHFCLLWLWWEIPAELLNYIFVAPLPTSTKFCWQTWELEFLKMVDHVMAGIRKANQTETNPTILGTPILRNLKRHEVCNPSRQVVQYIS